MKILFCSAVVLASASLARADFASWADTSFTSVERTNPLVSGPQADPDRDGKPNLLEYVLVTDPKNAETSGYSTVAAGATTATITFRERRNRNDSYLRILLCYSTDLSTWVTVNNPIEQSRVMLDATTDLVTWRVPNYVVTPGSSIYLSLAATQDSPVSTLGQLFAPGNVETQIVAPGQVRITWSDNSPLETRYSVRRRVISTNAITTLYTTGPDINELTDNAVPTSGMIEYFVAPESATTQGSIAVAYLDTNDSDCDRILDAEEAALGLNKKQYADAFRDADGDRIPNLWEMRMSGAAAVMNSGLVPPDTFIVDPLNANVSTTDNVVSTISSALAAAGSVISEYVIIRVRKGTYTGNLIFPTGKKIALLAEYGPNPVILLANGSSAAVAVKNDAVIDGFVISRTTTSTGTGLWMYGTSAAGYSSCAYLTNCIISNQTYAKGAATYNDGGRVVLNHCTLLQNAASSFDAHSTYASSTSCSYLLENSVCWNVAANLLYDLSRYSSMNIVSSSARNGPLRGEWWLDPLLAAQRWSVRRLSPVIGYGAGDISPRFDIHGELRDSTPDLGADEFQDTDLDGIPDVLDRFAGGDADGDSDNDGLNDLAEYETVATDPNRPDTDGDGFLDGFEIAKGWDPLSAGSPALGTDSDGDGMPDALEIAYFGDLSKTATHDPDADGLSAKDEMDVGSNPTINDFTDPSSAQLETINYTPQRRLGSVNGAASYFFTHDEEGNLKAHN